MGLYKIFPFPQLLALKHYVEQSTGTFEAQIHSAPTGDVEIRDTFLQRLLIKKIPIDGFSGHGGGIATSGNMLYIVTNKGSVQTFDLDNYSVVENTIPDVPMNFSGLIQSGHPYKNGFRILWFRVNGVYSESIDSDTHLLFVSHNAYDGADDCITHNISRIKVDLEHPDSQNNVWETIFTAVPCIDPEPDKYVAETLYSGHISGGAITNFDEDHLLVSVGDYNRHGIKEVEEYAMDPSNPYGKFILVDKNSGEWSVFAMGSRNAPALYIDENSTIWSVENGPQGGDELNIITKGENYGWPKVSYGIWYDPTLKLSGEYKEGTHPEYKQPVKSWVPSVAPSSIIKIEGEKFYLWKGDLLVGTMRDQSLYRLRPDRDGHIVYSERINLGHRIRDMVTLPDDKIALVTDDAFLFIIGDGGAIFRDVDSDIQERIASLEKFDGFSIQTSEGVTEAYANSAKVIFQQNCATCHNLEPNNQIGPHLHDLFNREVGAVDNFNYSQTLKTDGRTWNAQLLRSFLENPESEFAGNNMQKINLSPSEIDSLIKIFENQEEN